MVKDFSSEHVSQSCLSGQEIEFMSQQKIKRTCPVCYGTGKPTGDKSVGEIVTGYCYKCNGSGEVTEHIKTPQTTIKTTITTGAGAGSGLSTILGWIFAIPVLCVFGLLGSQTANITDNILTQVLVACGGTFVVFLVTGLFFGYLIGKIFSR